MAELEIPDVEELEHLKKDTFSKRVALVIALYAVALAITSLGGSNAMKEMLLAQQQASNAWAHYQAKVLREHLYGSQRDMLKVKLLEADLKPEVRAKYDALLAEMSKKEADYRKEKKDIEKEAKKLEQERDVARSKDPYFDYAEVLLQIAVVLGSLAILSGSRPLFVGSVLFSGIGTLLCLNGFLLLVKIPFLQ
jgi:hypothetical protein